jgi:hypothetical protein
MPETVGERLAAAQSAAKEASSELSQTLKSESRARVEKLLEKSVAYRYKALEDNGLKLLQADRRELVRSVRDARAPKRDIAATTASRVEIWRSQLPYKIFPLLVSGIAIVAAIGLAAVAYHRTPQQWVTIATDRSFAVQASGPDGELADRTVAPGDRFALVRVEGNDGIVRDWVAEKGYRELRVPLQYLQSRQ